MNLSVHKKNVAQAREVVSFVITGLNPCGVTYAAH